MHTVGEPEKEMLEIKTRTHSLSFAVVEAVATCEDVSEGNLPPLADVINPEALDELFEPRADGSPRRGGMVRFEYCGHTVVVDDGEVTVE